MHPAPSIILFTTISGLGYGLLIVYCALVLAGVIPQDSWLGGTTVFIGAALAGLGLSFSVLHLKHPERAWRALSQWRSSWLSREGVAALMAYIPIGLLLLGSIGWLDFGPLASSIFNILIVLGAFSVLRCTGMIYASLKPIRQWHHPMVSPLYMLFALQTGALAMLLIASFFEVLSLEMMAFALLATIIAWSGKALYWRSIDQVAGVSTGSTATGLAGDVQLFEAPHTEKNYLLSEMGYSVARKHVRKLRRIALLLGALIPALLIASLVVTGWDIALVIVSFAMATAFAGVLIERWLFFAEATHTQMLYYGTKSV